MTGRGNGQDTQYRVAPSNGAGEAVITQPFPGVTDHPAAAGQAAAGQAAAGQAAAGQAAGERRRADATRLREAREAGAQDERHWLARELHDSAAPALHSIGLLARAALAGLDSDPEKVRAALNLVLAFSQKQLDEMRHLMTYMHSESLVEALSATADFTREYSGLQVETELGPEPPLAAQVKVGLYMIAREAMHNATKHAPGCRLRVRLEQREGQLLLAVSDDGPGFDATAVPPDHYGLVSMRDRAALLGGRLEIRSAIGAGTCVCIAVQLAA